MRKISLALILIFSFYGCYAEAPEKLEKDTIKTSDGDLTITFIGHGSLLLNYQDNNIYIDPDSRLADYSTLPKADAIFLTHDHGDHLDPTALKQIRTDKTAIALTEKCAKKIKGGTILKNGDVKTIRGIKTETVPAYNIMHKRPNGQPFHPKGEGNGYVLTFGDKRLYIAGDTENIPEMKALKNIDYAFLPMNLPYTMTPEMAADAARSFNPKALYPYHYGETDTSEITQLLKDKKNIEVRIRQMK